MNDMTALKQENQAEIELDFEKENAAPVSIMHTAVAEKEKKRHFYFFMKRTFDLFCSLLGIALLSPLFLIIAIMIKREDGGPVLHRRVCVGKQGKTYIMYKFRSMKVNADNMLDQFSQEQLEQYKLGVKLEDDPRITRIGRYLRKTSADELAQLFSVVRNDMSLVGPRPVIEREAAEYGADREILLSCKPGITGCWQVLGRGTVPFLSEKGKKLQLYYVKHQSIGLDIKILFKTVKAVLSRKGAR